MLTTDPQLGLEKFPNVTYLPRYYLLSFFSRTKIRGQDRSYRPN